MATFPRARQKALRTSETCGRTVAMNGADRATGRRSRTPSAQVASELLNAAESALVKVGMRGLTTAIEADKQADARAWLVSVNVKHGRPCPAKAVVRVSRATLLAHSPETTHDARTGQRCSTPRRIWRQAVKGDKHGA
jgi:hypothetical protein